MAPAIIIASMVLEHVGMPRQGLPQHPTHAQEQPAAHRQYTINDATEQETAIPHTHIRGQHAQEHAIIGASPVRVLMRQMGQQMQADAQQGIAVVEHVRLRWV